MSKIKQIIIMMVITILAISCGAKKENTATESKKIKITTTTTMLTDLIKNIGGDKVEVEGLMGEGIDPHLYNASAGDIDKLSKADMIIFAGLHLEGKMGDIFENLSKTKTVVDLGSKLDPSKIMMEDVNVQDPHIWFDTELWTKEAEIVAEELSKIDSNNANYYKENFEKYKNEIVELKKYAINRINEIEEKSRVLVTAHDAFGYFGREFGIEVKAIQGVSTDSEAATKNISELADFIVERNIKAIFVESSVPKKSIEALQEAVKAKGKEVKIGGELYSDSLGDKEHNSETYLKMFKKNVDTLVDALK